MSTLMEITAEARELYDELVKAEGEIDTGLEAVITAMESQVAVKTDGYVEVMRMLEHEAVYWSDLAKEANAKAKTLMKRREWLKQNLKKAMRMMGTNTLNGHIWRLQTSKTKGRLVIDEDRLPSEWAMTVTEVKPDKERITKALKEGVVIPGAELQEGESLRTYMGGKGE